MLSPLRRGARRRGRRLPLRALRGSLPDLRPHSLSGRRSGALADDVAASARRLHGEHRVARRRSCSARRRRLTCCRGRSSGCCASRTGSRSRSRRSRRCSSRSTRARTRMVAAAIPSRPEPGSQAAILECYEHVFRDWAWGERECALTLDFVKPMVPAGARPRRDLRRRRRSARGRRPPGVRAGADVRPRRQSAAVPDRGQAARRRDDRLCRSFPSTRTPTTSSSSTRHLARPFAVRDGFSLLFADALRPPFPAASLDAVVTSWFIDVARADLRQTAAAINRVLRPGGVWVNLGPLRFHAVLSRAYTIEEVHEIVGRSAFELTAARQPRPALLRFAHQRLAPHRQGVRLRGAQDRRGAGGRHPRPSAALGRRTRSSRSRSRRRWWRSAARRCSRPACCR